MLKSIFLFLTLLYAYSVAAQGMLQNEDFKTEAELITAGGAKSQLLNDTKIYVTANSINETLDDAISNGLIGFQSPLTTEGDLLAFISGSPARIGIGSNGQVLTVSGGVPTWITPTGGIDINAQTEKVAPVGADELLIADSDDTYSLKKILISNLPSSTPSLSIQVTNFTSGSGTYNVPAGTYALYVESRGGGGGGAGGTGASTSSASVRRGGGGGGSGGYSFAILLNPDSSYSYTVGGGGSAGGNSSAGGSGGGSTCAGVVAGGGGGGAPNNTQQGGAGGSGNVVGKPGGVGSVTQASPSTVRSCGGSGGGDGGGRGRCDASGATAGTGGTGGGGAGQGSDSSTTPGTAGGSGYCRFTAYISN